MSKRAPVEAFVDTSVFLRFLTRDHEKRAERTRVLLEAAALGDADLHVNHLSFAELAFALRSQYRMPRGSIAERLADLLAVRGLRVPDRGMLQEAVELYRDHNVSFADAHFVADMRKRELRSIYAYDRDFETLGVRRLEP